MWILLIILESVRKARVPARLWVLTVSHSLSRSPSPSVSLTHTHCLSLSFLSPVVCYVADRNELRHRVIQWLQTEVVPDGWFVKGSNFTDILLKYFKVCVSVCVAVCMCVPVVILVL